MSNLVTGGSGFLGRYLVEQLVARGETIRVFCRSEPECLSLPGVTWIRGDVRDVEAVTRVCRDISTVFHCAAVPGIWGPWSLYESINTQGTRNLLAAAAAAGAARFVYTSSPSVIFDGSDMIDVDESRRYPDRFLCGYPRSKALAEAAVLAANGQDDLTTVALRPHLIWGPRDNHLLPRMIQRARRGRLRRVGDGDQTRDEPRPLLPLRDQLQSDRLHDRCPRLRLPPNRRVPRAASAAAIIIHLPTALSHQDRFGGPFSCANLPTSCHSA